MTVAPRCMPTGVPSNSQLWSKKCYPGESGVRRHSLPPIHWLPIHWVQQFHCQLARRCDCKCLDNDCWDICCTNSIQAFHSPSFSLVPYKGYGIDLTIISSMERFIVAFPRASYVYVIRLQAHIVNDLPDIFPLHNICSFVTSGSNNMYSTRTMFSCVYQA